MTIAAALWGFSLTALLMTLTPGMDTALVLRTAILEGVPEPCVQAAASWPA